MRFQIFILLLVILSSCQKIDEVSLVAKIIETPTDFPIRDIDFNSEGDLIVCTGKREYSGHIFRSDDDGESWFSWQSDLNHPFYSLGFRDSILGFAGSEGTALFRTENKGHSFQRQWLEPEELPYHGENRAIIRKIQFVNDSLGYFVCGENYSVGSLYRTTDGGASWTFDTLAHELRGMHFFNENSGFVSGFGFLGKVGHDGALSQTKFSGDFFVAVHMLSPTEIVVCGNNGGIYKSIDSGNSWYEVLRPNGYISSRREFTDLSFNEDNIGYAVGWDAVIFQSLNGGEDWIKVNLSEYESDTHFHAVHIEGERIFLGSSNGTISIIDSN